MKTWFPHPLPLYIVRVTGERSDSLLVRARERLGVQAQPPHCVSEAMEAEAAVAADALFAEERRALTAAQARAGREAADARLAEEEAEKASTETQKARARRKEQSQKTERAEAAPEPALVGGARSGPAPLGADPPSQCSGSQAAGARAGATGAVNEEGQRAAAEEGLEGAGGAVPDGVDRRASQASDGADERGGAEEEERYAAVAMTLGPPPVVAVSAGEVLRALEAAGYGEVGEGGFGKVFAAELPSLVARWGRVAVKRASGVHAADILQEVATLRLCSHCNVLPLLGYCDDVRALCMITPLMHGGSLDDRLLLSDNAFERMRRLGFEGDACLNWKRRLSALCDAARGLAHLHGERRSEEQTSELQSPM